VVAARLDAVRGQLDSVVTWSDSQMTREETSGGSCGTASAPVAAPLQRRRSVRDSITTLRDGMTKTWLEPVQADIEQLRQAATALGGATVEERQRAFETKASEIRGRARNIAARSNQLGKSTAGEMRALASTVAIAPGAAGFSCYDPTLAERLRAAGAQAEQPAELKLREAVFNEGPAGVANAVKNLWRNIGAYTGSLFSYLFTRGDTGVVGRTDTENRSPAAT
jgi:DNA-binding ferritin-like protein